MRHTPIMVALLCLGALPVPSGFGAEKPPHSVLEGVAALEKPVTYTQTKVPLGDLVRRISRESGVPLTATRQGRPVAMAELTRAQRRLFLGPSAPRSATTSSTDCYP